jgi:4-alpha-glucanotransferase
MLTRRASGILLHPTSLPGPYGAGDLGADAYRFVDWLKSAGQTYWQVLPLGEIGPGNSPYMSSSAFAGNVLLIDIAELAHHGWLSTDDLAPHLGFRTDRVDFSLQVSFRMERLRRAAGHFLAQGNERMRRDYDEFCLAEREWLQDYALFMTIARHQRWREWSRWPAELLHRDPQALRVVGKDFTEEIFFWKFCQWNFARQWVALKSYANTRGVRIIGDMPIFVAYQSADVWAHQDLFELDENGRPTVVAGVPPDYFSKTGQLWGNPLYRWDAHEKSGYAWWIARTRHALKLADIVRIDHFRGFAACWEIPADAPNAIPGKWTPGPGEKLFKALKTACPHLPIIAEDLGIITRDVVELRDRFGLPGMRVLQFAFGEGEEHYFLPHNYVPNTIAYTGTHDNDTAIGWWNSAPDREKDFAQRYLNSEGNKIQWDMMRALAGSAANTVVYPMQDVLGLDSEHRMNFPGQPSGNWEWRFSWAQLRPEYTLALAELAAGHKRNSNT